MNQTLNTRTVQANGEAIKRLRTERGWRVEDLARKAKCSVKTIKNVERGASVYLFTLRTLAEVFSVEYSTLTTDIISLTQEIPIVNRKRTWEVTLRISTPFEEFDETTDLPRFLSELIKRIGGTDIDPIDPVSITEGSTEITVRMTLDQLADFARAYVNDQLDDLKIISVKAPAFDKTDPSKYLDGDKLEFTFYEARVVSSRLPDLKEFSSQADELIRETEKHMRPSPVREETEAFKEEKF